MRTSLPVTVTVSPVTPLISIVVSDQGTDHLAPLVDVRQGKPRRHFRVVVCHVEQLFVINAFHLLLYRKAGAHSN